MSISSTWPSGRDAARLNALRIMVVDDSVMICGPIARWIDAEPDTEVVASLRTGRDAVSETVIAQDEATSVVRGMPGAVAPAALCAAMLPLTRIAAHPNRLVAGVRA